MNKVILVGHLGKDPDVRYTQNGNAVASFPLAVNSGYGENKRTDWVNIIAWRKLAETVGNNLNKGRRVLVEGSLNVRSYEAKDGSGKRYVTEVVAQNVEFLDGKKSEQPSAENGFGMGEEVFPEEEIPF